MNDLPLIRLEIESMRYQIVHALSTHNAEIEQAVANEVEKVIAHYPFSEQISKLAGEIIAKALKQSLESYFLLGDGQRLLSEYLNELLGHWIRSQFPSSARPENKEA